MGESAYEPRCRKRSDSLRTRRVWTRSPKLTKLIVPPARNSAVSSPRAPMSERTDGHLDDPAVRLAALARLHTWLADGRR